MQEHARAAVLPDHLSPWWRHAVMLTLIIGFTVIALVLFAFGKFSFLGWKGEGECVHPQLLPGITTASQRATIKYFVVVALLFLAQALVGGATAHYRADPASFYGLDLSTLLPSHLARTWHLQLAIFWVATAYIAGGLFLAPAVGGREPAGQATGVNMLLGALVVVVVGSLVGELLGIHRLLGDRWFWLGHQGWEYLDLGRAWQILLALGLVLWLVLLGRGMAPARRDPERREVASLFLYAAMALTVFALRQVLTDAEWQRPARYVRWAFWGLNIGLAMMVVANLFPGGVLQLLDVLQHGYWHARSPAFLQTRLVRVIEWLRLPGDAIFIGAGVVPMVLATALTYRMVRRHGQP